jgi:hypothetical protein
LLDTTTQTIASANTPQVVTFNTTLNNDKIAVTSTSRFTFNEAGSYSVNLGAEITAGVANKTGDIWIRVNGSDVANSNRKRTIINNETGLITLIGFTITVTAGQYVEVWFSGDDTSVALPAFAAGTTPTRPVTPSIMMEIIRTHP